MDFAVSGTTSVRLVAPLADMLNHSLDVKQCHAYDPKSGDLSILAAKDYQVGDQVRPPQLISIDAQFQKLTCRQMTGIHLLRQRAKQPAFASLWVCSGGQPQRQLRPRAPNEPAGPPLRAKGKALGAGRARLNLHHPPHREGPASE